MNAVAVGTLRVPLNQMESERHGDRAYYNGRPGASYL